MDIRSIVLGICLCIIITNVEATNSTNGTEFEACNSTTEFTCYHNDNCIPLTSVKDNINDCGDASDEVDVPCAWKPSGYQFNCFPAKSCRPWVDYLDNYPDCEGTSSGADERKKLGDKCFEHTDPPDKEPCLKSITNAVCSTSNVCECITGYKQETWVTCEIRVYSDPCNTTVDCTLGISGGECRNSICGCAVEYEYVETASLCRLITTTSTTTTTTTAATTESSTTPVVSDVGFPIAAIAGAGAAAVVIAIAVVVPLCCCWYKKKKKTRLVDDTGAIDPKDTRPSAEGASDTHDNTSDTDLPPTPPPKLLADGTFISRDIMFNTPPPDAEIVNSVNKSWANDFQSKSKAMKGKFKNKKKPFSVPVKTIKEEESVFISEDSPAETPESLRGDMPIPDV